MAYNYKTIKAKVNSFGIKKPVGVEDGFNVERNFTGLDRLRLHRLDHVGEHVRFFSGQVGQDLAVQLDVVFSQGVDETAVAHAQGFHRGVEAQDPQGAVVALLLFAVSERVGASFHHGASGFAVEFAALSTVAFGQFDELLVSAAEGRASFDSGHGGKCLES